MSPLSLFEKKMESVHKGNFSLKLSKDYEVEIYPNSINRFEEALLFLGIKNFDKKLFIITGKENLKNYDSFDGEIFEADQVNGELYFKVCNLNHANVLCLQKLFPFTRPVLLGIGDSFGYGDRLGIANPGHVRASMQHKFRPIFAQQSIRELTRTQRSPYEVMDAAVWAVFQEGYKDGFGADADHLKTKEDIDLMMNAGFTFFTIDSGDYVDNNADNLNEVELLKKIGDIDLSSINETGENIIKRYQDKTFEIGNELKISPSRYEILNAITKYGKCFLHIKILTDYLKEHYHDRQYEVEISIDETLTPTNPFDHLFIVSELRNLGIDFISIAPHFVGGFEKGIDYKKDLDEFTRHFVMHSVIAKYFGNYKLSFHSGSDKFNIYKKVAEVRDRSHIHVKTAGTSYLVALNVIAIKSPDLFRKILDFSVEEYKIEKESYHVSADLKVIKPSDKYTNDELSELFYNDSARQVLHVTFGKVLTEKDSDNKYLFKSEIIKCLVENEELHYQLLVEHFNKHLNPFD